MGFLLEILLHFLLEVLATPVHYLVHLLVERKR